MTKFCSPIPEHLLDFNYTGFYYQFNFWRSSGRIEWFYSQTPTKGTQEKNGSKVRCEIKVFISRGYSSLCNVLANYAYRGPLGHLLFSRAHEVKYANKTSSLKVGGSFQTNDFRVLLEVVVVAVLVDHRLPEVSHSFREKCLSLCSLLLVLSV